MCLASHGDERALSEELREESYVQAYREIGPCSPIVASFPISREGGASEI
jgi:hypothetical protein